MGLSKKDKEFFKEYLNQTKQPSIIPSSDLIFRGISTLSMVMIIWIFSTTNQLKEDVEVIKATNNFTNKKIENLENFARSPRFTKEDFNQAINPIITNLNKNTLELNNRNDFMKDVEERLIKLEIKVNTYSK